PAFGDGVEHLGARRGEREHRAKLVERQRTQLRERPAHRIDTEEAVVGGLVRIDEEDRRRRGPAHEPAPHAHHEQREPHGTLHVCTAPPTCVRWLTQPACREGATGRYAARTPPPPPA